MSAKVKENEMFGVLVAILLVSIAMLLIGGTVGFFVGRSYGREETEKKYAPKKEWEEKKNKFIENKEQIKNNNKLIEKLRPYEFRRSKVKEALDETSRSLMDLNIKIGTVRTRIEEIKASMVEYETLVEEYEAYEYFLKAMSKDGIARMIIAENIGVINKEIEKILSQGVGFTVELESSANGKAIDIFFRHPRSPRRLIEICCGMEKTLAAIAIRAALINITTLPRSNIFVIDEAFESLDPEYVASLVAILDYLKQLFEIVIIITHIDSFKDIVDYVVEIERNEEGYAKIHE